MLTLLPAAEAVAERMVRVWHPVDHRPLDHINHNGLSEDILSDYWRLWSAKTGVAVEFKGGLFEDCLKEVEQDPDAVLSGVYYSAAHDAVLALSQRMLTVRTVLFARSRLDVENIDEASAYAVGVVTGDGAQAFLERHRPDIKLHAFGTSEELVRFAVEDSLDVFALDYPSAMHLLDTHRALTVFEPIQTLMAGRICAGVGEDHGQLLLTINKGIDLIPEEEVNAIFDRHLPHPWVFPRWATRYVVGGVAVVLLLGGVGHVLLLKRTVRFSTKELREKNDRLHEEMVVRKQVEAALAEQNRRLQEMNQELDRLASTDALTGLYNRRHLMDRLTQELDRSARYRNPLSILLLDLDHFKLVNDTHGHLIGDAVLLRTGEIIAECARTTDLPGRYGGEEFALVLPQTDMSGACELAERLRQRLAEVVHRDTTGEPFRVTCSIGVASVNGNANANRLLKHADDALYRAKSQGRDQIASAAEEELEA